MGATTSVLDEEANNPLPQPTYSPHVNEPPPKILKTSGGASNQHATKNMAIIRNNSTAQGMKVNNVSSYTAGASYGNGMQHVKVVILGCASVGKASFVNRTVKGQQGEKRGTTEIVFKTMLLKNTNITFQIVMVNDETFVSDGEIYDAAGVFLMYDATNRESFHAIESVYLPKLKRCCPYSLSTVLIASKVDGWPEVTNEEGKLLALMNHIHFCEVSTRDNINMQKPFTIVAEAVAKTHGCHSI